MKEHGWITLHRKISDHWLYQEKRSFSRFEAWVDILLCVNHSEQKITIEGTLLVCKRGQSLHSLETWGKRWKWDKSKVRRFLKLLESDTMIELKSERKTTRITVCKYDSYQTIRNANETQSIWQTTPNNNDNNENKEYMSIFEGFRSIYPGTKRGLETEFKELKKHSDWKTVLPLLTPALNNEIRHKQALIANNEFCASWKNLKTWLNGRCWEQEIKATEIKKQALLTGLTN